MVKSPLKWRRSIDSGAHIYVMRSGNRANGERWQILPLVLMMLPLAHIENKHIFSLKRDIIGSCVARTSIKLLRARAQIKVHADPIWYN
jgi:hypothetical protein